MYASFGRWTGRQNEETLNETNLREREIRACRQWSGSVRQQAVCTERQERPFSYCDLILITGAAADVDHDDGNIPEWERVVFMLLLVTGNLNYVKESICIIYGTGLTVLHTP